MKVKIENDDIIDAWNLIKKCSDNRVELERSVFILDTVLLELLEKNA